MTRWQRRRKNDTADDPQPTRSTHNLGRHIEIGREHPRPSERAEKGCRFLHDMQVGVRKSLRVPEINSDEVHTTSADATKPSSGDTVCASLRHNMIVRSETVGPPRTNRYAPRRTISASAPSRRHGAVPTMAPQPTDGGCRGFFPQSFGLLQQDHVGGRARQHRSLSGGDGRSVGGVNNPKFAAAPNRIGPPPDIGEWRNGPSQRSASLRVHAPPLSRVTLTPAAIGQPQPARPPFVRTRRATTIGVRARGRIAQQIERAVQQQQARATISTKRR